MRRDVFGGGLFLSVVSLETTQESLYPFLNRRVKVFASLRKNVCAYVRGRKGRGEKNERRRCIKIKLSRAARTPISVFLCLCSRVRRTRTNIRSRDLLLPRVSFLLPSSDGRDLFRLLQAFLLKLLLPLSKDLRDIFTSSIHFFFIRR